MKKQWFVVLVAMVLLLSVCLLAACEGDMPGEADASIGDDTPGDGDASVGDDAPGEDDGETTEGLAYHLKEDGTYAVTGIGVVTDDTITIPSAYQGKSVSEIADYAFRSCTSLTSITIPLSVTSIGCWAFYNTGLTSVTFANTTGWYVTTRSNATAMYGTSVTVTDAVQNATYLKDTYRDYFWRRNG